MDLILVVVFYSVQALHSYERHISAGRGFYGGKLTVSGFGFTSEDLVEDRPFADEDDEYNDATEHVDGRGDSRNCSFCGDFAAFGSFWEYTADRLKDPKNPSQYEQLKVQDLHRVTYFSYSFVSLR